eukprot:337068_1
MLSQPRVNIRAISTNPCCPFFSTFACDLTTPICVNIRFNSSINTCIPLRQYTPHFKHQYMHPSASIYAPIPASIHASLCVNTLPISSINTCIPSMYAPIQAPIHASLCVNIRPNSSINTCIPLRQYTPQFKHQYMHPSASIHAPIQ